MSTAGPQRPDRMPEDMPDRTPDRMSERMPEDMPDKVPECLPDRMPEDMPDRLICFSSNLHVKGLNSSLMDLLKGPVFCLV